MEQSAPVSHWLPCPVVFISTAYGEKRDIMTATAMFISEKEPLLAMSVAKGHLTEQLIEQAGTFTLIMASESQKDLVWKLGSTKGGAEDKFDRFAIKTLPSQPGKPLVPAESAAWLECTVVNQHPLEGYVLITARATSQENLGNPPLVWQNQSLFTLKTL
jgi:flavin reductase (DIM6/NTAB) family NADH-FMN oxidoreductase RutF